MGYSFLLFLALPLVDLIVLFKFGARFGFWTTMGLVVGAAALGSYLVRREGTRAVEQVRQKLAAGQIPAFSIVDRLLIMVAGILLLIPGLITDLMGLLLLFPPVRTTVHHILMRRWNPFPKSSHRPSSAQRKPAEEIITVYANDKSSSEKEK